MKKYLLVPALCAMLVSCDRNRPNTMADATDDSLQNAEMQSDQTPTADWEITAKVKKAILMDSSLSANAKMISVTTDSGIVTLTGTVASNEENRKVMQIVKAVPGVLSIRNQLTVSTK